MIFRSLTVFVLICFSSCSSSNHEPEFGSYSIGRDSTWFPLNFQLQTPNINAFVNAFTATIARTQAVPMNIINVNWDELYTLLEEREYAGAFTSLPMNPANLARYTFSQPFILLGPVLIVPEHSSATSLETLNKNAIIGVNQFDDSVLIAQRYPSHIIELYQNMPQALEDLVAGRIDAVLMPTLDAKALVPNLYFGILKIVTPPLSDKALRLITLRDENDELIHHFNAGLSELHATGQYKQLREKFGVK